jgi:hypothetical protein
MKSKLRGNLVAQVTWKVLVGSTSISKYSILMNRVQGL